MKKNLGRTINMSDCNTFWTSDPMVLVTCITELWPWTDGFSMSQQYNALTRLVVIIAIAMAVIEKSYVPLLFGLGMVVAVLVVYHVSDSGSGSGTQQQMSQERTYSVVTQPLEESFPVDESLSTVDPDNQNPYGNVTADKFLTAVNQKPLGCMTQVIPGDQFIDKLFTGSEITPPGLNFNRVPDNTLMAREPYPLSSMDMSTRAIGDTDNSGSLAMRY